MAQQLSRELVNIFPAAHVMYLDHVVIGIDRIDDPESLASQGIVTGKLLFQRLPEERVLLEPFNVPFDDRLCRLVRGLVLTTINLLKIFHDLPPLEFLWSLSCTGPAG